MSVYKNRQTDGSASFWQRLLRRPCPSFLDKSLALGGTQRHECVGIRGHQGRHCDGSGLSWCYGEEFFGGKK